MHADLTADEWADCGEGHWTQAAHNEAWTPDRAWSWDTRLLRLIALTYPRTRDAQGHAALWLTCRALFPVAFPVAS